MISDALGRREAGPHPRRFDYPDDLSWELACSVWLAVRRDARLTDAELCAMRDGG